MNVKVRVRDRVRIWAGVRVNDRLKVGVRAMVRATASVAIKTLLVHADLL